MNDNSNLQNKDEKTFDQNVSDLANLYSTNIPVQPKQIPQKSVNNADNTSSVIPEKSVSVPSAENSVSDVSSQNKEDSSDTTTNSHVTYAPRIGTTMIGDVNPALLEAFIGPNYYILAMIEKDGYVYNFRGEDVGNEWNQEFINTYNQIFQSIQFK